MKEEIDALKQNDTWNLVDANSSINIVGSKWVFKERKKVNRSIDKHNARLVARDFCQEEGVDFQYTYSPMARISTVRIVLSL